MSDTTLQTAELGGIIPSNTIDEIVANTATLSTVAALSGSEPMKFGDVDMIIWNEEAVAEFVDEGGAKSSQKLAPVIETSKPKKAVVQFRTSDEVLHADDEYKLGIYEKFAAEAAKAISRALDLGAYFRTNPKTGNEITSWENYLNSTANRVEFTAGSDEELAVEAAAGLIVPGGVNATGVALAPNFAWGLKTARYEDGRRKNENFNVGIDGGAVLGLPSSTSFTVQGKARSGDATDNKVRAIVGDFDSGIRWGIQKEIPFRILRYGDPDNSGRDLAGHNEVMLRAEVFFGWYVNPEKFAVVEETAGE